MARSLQSTNNNLSYVSGRYYQPEHFVNALGTLAITANRLYAVPFRVRATAPFDRLGIRVTTSIDGAKVRTGLFKDLSGNPASLLLDAGEATLSGTGAQDASMTIAQVLNYPTWVWLAVVSDSAITLTAASTSNVLPLLGDTAFSDTRNLLGVFGSLTYGAMPSTFPTITVTVNAVPVPKVRAQ